MYRHRVFISSTIEDLQAERDAVEQELNSLGFFEVTRVEKLPATDKPSERICLDEVARSDALLLILGTRYGFIPPKDNPQGLSVTHIEYREATRLGLRVFAYVQRTRGREPGLDSFVEEVSDYHEGLLRRTWPSVNELRTEVRRTAVNWLSSDLRSGQMQTAADLVAAEIGKFSVDASAAEIGSPGVALWLSNFLQSFEADCRARFLPLPTLDAIPDSYFSIRVHVSPSGDAHKLRLELHRRPEEHNEDNGALVKLELNVKKGEIQTAVRTAAALVQSATDDSPAAIGTILEVARGLTASDENRERLLECAAIVSTLDYGRLSESVVGEILTLSHLQLTTVNAAACSLLAAQARYELSGASRAFQETGELYFRLMLAALERSESKPESIYNLAREAAQRSPKLGLSLYEELLRAEPSYEERWYFHRDLGLIQYGLEQYSGAAEHYDHACHLRDRDSKLWRHAGDAHYYDGRWAEALIRFEKAMTVDSIELYFLDMKVRYCRSRIAQGKPQERGFSRRRRRSARLVTWGTRVAESDHATIASLLFRVANRLCDLNFDAHRWLALYSNRTGDYNRAVTHLENALSAIPEDPFVRLNLVANLVFRTGGVFDRDSLLHARVAVFHGGPDMLDRFRVQMSNTAGREGLVVQMSEVLESVAEERDQWLERRRNMQLPERHGDVDHLEFRW